MAVKHHRFVIRAADRTIELSFDKDPAEWNEIYGSGQAVTGREPEQFQEGDQRVGRITTRRKLDAVIRILVEEAGLISERTAARLRRAAARA